jgi:hypothetical protein
MFKKGRKLGGCECEVKMRKHLEKQSSEVGSKHIFTEERRERNQGNTGY